MSWQCRLIDVIGTRSVRFDPQKDGRICGETQLLTADGQAHSYRGLPPGTMFYLPEKPVHDGDDAHPWPWCLFSEKHLSDYYRQHNARRRPLLVILPGHELFLVDGKCWKGSELYGGWQVTGEVPNITVAPSINIVGFYHGWLQNGVISDDCEGRKFEANGDSIR